MLHTQSDYEDASQPTGPKTDNYLQGILTKIRANASRTVVTLHLKETATAKKEEDAEEYVPSQSTSSKPSLRNGQQKRKSLHGETFARPEDGADHLIKLHGSWCQLLAEDLTMTLNLKVYLDCYKPELDLKTKCWEFWEGLRADLFMHNPTHRQSQRDPVEPKIFCKKIDLGPMDLDSLDETKLEDTDEEEEEHDLRNFNGRTFHNNANNPFYPSNSVKHRIKQEYRSGEEEEQHTQENPAGDPSPNPHKRICAQVESGIIPSNPPDPDLETHNPPPSPNPSLHPDLTRRTPSHPSSTLPNPSGDRPVAADGVRSSKECDPVPKQKSLVWKTLDEIDKMVGGPGERFNAIGIIKSKQTETSTKTSGGALDYKMTLYLVDSSRPRGCRDVTCNLFTRSEPESPSWLSAAWAVIMLFNVYKRRSEIYSTQIIAPASFSDWAVWCPAYFGSAERLECSLSRKNKNLDSSSLILNKFNLTEEALKQLARQLHQDHSASDSLPQTVEDLNSYLPPINSVPMSITEVRHGNRHQVDLCVRIVDVWIDAPGNDRLTVTDYTTNRVLKVPKPRSLVSDMTSLDMSPTPIARFHTDNGGDETNWRLTENRLMSIYVAPPILQVICDKLQNSERSDRSRAVGPTEIKSMLTNMLFKFNQVEIRVRSGSSNGGILYGFIGNPLVNADSPDLKLLKNLDDLSYDLLASKIVPLKPSDPAYRQLLRGEEVYKREFKENS